MLCKHGQSPSSAQKKKSCIAKDDITTPLTLKEIASSYQSSEMIDYRREVD